ncbi:MAG: ABC transporter ATP-binding protein [Smithellaceae bacterium]|nr:ABC transporter ATP-binding protein [Smithellaceae bacterium]
MYLEIKDLTVLYDRAMVLNKASLHVERGELVSLVGPNGAGKTTLLRAVSGLIKWEREALRGTVLGKITIEGSVKFEGKELINLDASEIIKHGIVLTPERGRPFKEMTVKENLMAGAYLVRDKKKIKETLEQVYELFPILQKRENQTSGTISGGERTMLAIGRSLMSQAKLLLIDEPSVGLAPKVKEDMFKRIADVHGLGVTILMTEQDISFAFELSKRNYVISQGQVLAEGSPEFLLQDETIRRNYLGL